MALVSGGRLNTVANNGVGARNSAEGENVREFFVGLLEKSA